MSEETIRSLAGHGSKQMLERYSHIRQHANIVAISGLEETALIADEAETASDRAQNRAQSHGERLN